MSTLPDNQDSFKMNRSQIEPTSAGTYSSSGSPESRPAANPPHAPSEHSPFKSKKLIFSALGLVVLAGAYFVFNAPKNQDSAAGDTGGKAGAKNRPVPVTVATAQIQNVPIE